MYQFPTGYNYALRRKASQSSTWRSKYAASKAVDGKEKTFTVTKNENNAYWSVDLRKTVNVKQINIINRKDCCGNRLKNIVVTVGQNPHGMKLCNNFKGPGKTGQIIMITWKNEKPIKPEGKNEKQPVKPEGENKKPKPEGYNYALGKKAAQSSTRYSIYVASLAVDGKESTFSQTENENNAYWSVDLGKTVNVKQIKIINRKNCCGYRLKNIAVTVGQNRHQMKLCSNFKGPGKTGQVIMLTCKSPISGRHVKLLRSGKGYLSLAEVQVIGHTGENEKQPVKPEGYNYALRRKASQSSTWRSKYAASKAVDGKEKTFTVTKNENNAYWSVDLRKTVNVKQINIINRKDCCGNRLKNIVVTVGQNPHGMKLCNNFKGPGKTGQIIMITCKRPIAGRHVKLLRRGKGFLTLAEVQVIGETGKNEKPIKPEGKNEKQPVKPEGENKKPKPEGKNEKQPVKPEGENEKQPVKPEGNRLKNIVVTVGQNPHGMKLCNNFKGPGKTGQIIMITCKRPIAGRHVKL
ncbi:unnamed protein product [Mytilus coruscus]|uniref:Fucolectin tachylectin-4 pentraxin-1 domain-containing protein n=1 Tax=Mytilus coruscus TaxID=42192 RepID=A0A6J8A0D7_MYTCO|nr:unnamed protein product [Mytilus coruscus]